MARRIGSAKRFVSMSRAALVSLFMLSTVHSSQALVTFSGSGVSRSGAALDATATFQQNGSQLVVTLANTSTADVLKPIDVLTAMFFTLANPANSGVPVALTPVSALVANGSQVLFGPPNTNVSGEYAYRNYTKKGPFGAQQGISSTTSGGFGKKNLFPGPVLQGKSSPDGLNYGITSTGDNPNTGAKSVTGGKGGDSIALVQNELVFTFDLPVGYTLGSISERQLPVRHRPFEEAERASIHHS